MISIITPCYNSERTIAQTIESVLGQSYTDWEMLVVDDCSTDGSAGIVNKYAEQDERIKYMKTDRASGSPSLPRNIGIDNAKGEYIAFLDSDDAWRPEKLQKQLEFAEKTGCHFVYSDYEKMGANGSLNYRYVVMPAESSYWDVLETCSIPCLTVLLSKDIIGKTRFLSIPKEDYAFWLEILRKGVVAKNSGDVLAYYRVSDKSRSSDKFAMIKNQWFVLRNIEGVKRPIALYLMMKYLYYGLIKYLK